jgi:hypothetical protein
LSAVPRRCAGTKLAAPDIADCPAGLVGVLPPPPPTHTVGDICCLHCLVCSHYPALVLLPGDRRLGGSTCGSGCNIWLVSFPTAGPTLTPVKVCADPWLWWRQTCRSLPSGHPWTLHCVLGTRPDHPWGNIHFVRARRDHGAFLLELAGSQMLNGKKKISQGVFC